MMVPPVFPLANRSYVSGCGGDAPLPSVCLTISLIVSIALVVVWGFMTFVSWAAPDYGDKTTLVTVLKRQWRWAVDLSGRIY